MAFSLFTKRSEYTSKRLRFIARGLQVFGVVAGAAALIAAFFAAKVWMLEWPTAVRDAYIKNNVIIAVGSCVSFFIIGRALLRRQRVGAYVAIATIGIPLAFTTYYRVTHPTLSWIYDAVSIGLPVLTLALVGSVWRELGTVLDSEFANHDPEPEHFESLTPRNRGYGELKQSHTQLPLQPAPTQSNERTPIGVASSKPSL